MSAEIYRTMTEVMVKRGGLYSGLDVPEFYALVETLFTPEEAEINNAFPRQPATAAEMAKLAGGETVKDLGAKIKSHPA